MVDRRLKLTAAIAALFLFAVLAVDTIRVQSAGPEEFYKGKTMRFIASSKPGGGTDLIVRLVAPYLKKYTGAYAVVVDNVEEAGGMVALI